MHDYKIHMANGGFDDFKQEKTQSERIMLLRQVMSPKANIEDELTVYSLLSADKQCVVDERLRIMAAYFAESPRTAAMTENAAGSLNMEKRNFYRLVAKMKDVGPVRALAPKFRNVQRHSMARDGLPEVIETSLRRKLKRSPEARLSEVYSFLETLYRDTDLPMPSMPTVRKRVAALRESPALRQARAKIAVGEHLVIDQCGIDLLITHAYSEPDRVDYGVVTLIVDQQSKLILGFALSVANGVAGGLELALDEMKVSIEALSEFGLRVAPSIKSVKWVTPPDMEEFGDVLQSSGAAQGVSVTPMHKGVRRHGAQLRRLIGNRLGHFRFRLMTTEDGGRVEANRSGTVPYETAHDLIRFAVRQRNEALLASLGSDRLSDEGYRGQKMQLGRLAEALKELFEPVFAGAAKQLWRSRRLDTVWRWH